MKRSYDLIVPFYDRLAALIYGNALRDAQTVYLPMIPASATVLIAGGGTGWVLEEITNLHQQGLQIDYIDSSAKMIREAKKKCIGENKVRFINQSIFNWQTTSDYDVIITPFFFDNFSETNAQKVFVFLHSKLKANGLWFYTDFQIAHRKAYWQRILLSIMYFFFRLATNIEAKRLPDIISQFHLFNYELINENTFFHRFIITSAYKKTND